MIYVKSFIKATVFSWTYLSQLLLPLDAHGGPSCVWVETGGADGDDDGGGDGGHGNDEGLPGHCHALEAEKNHCQLHHHSVHPSMA